MVERVATPWRPLRKISYQDQAEAFSYTVGGVARDGVAFVSYKATLNNGTNVLIKAKATLHAFINGAEVLPFMSSGDPVSVAAKGAWTTPTLTVSLPGDAAAGTVTARVDIVDENGNRLVPSVEKNFGNVSLGPPGVVTLTPIGDGFTLS